MTDHDWKHMGIAVTVMWIGIIVFMLVGLMI